MVNPVARFLIAVLTICFLYPAILKAQISKVLIKHPIEVERIPNWLYLLLKPSKLSPKNVADCCKLWSKRGQAFAYSVKNAELCLL